MTLESCPNEILLESFEFLDTAELFHAFYGLNDRFNALLFTQYQSYHVNFYYIAKYQSNFPALHYLPLITHQIVSLRLSDNNDQGLPQTDCFFSSGLLINRLIHLKSLSLCCIDDEASLRKFMHDCRHLAHLTHLKIVRCHTEYMSSVDFSNSLWGLAKLTHCCLDMQDEFRTPTIVSLSIEYLSISCRSWQLSQTTHLYQQTPRLCHLHLPLNNLTDYFQTILPYFLSISILNLSNVRSSKAMNTVLLAVPNLTYLKIDMHHFNYDGYLWESIIDKHLPKLEIFHLRMHIQLHCDRNDEQSLQKLVHSFCTDFWLKKHQWYIRYHRGFNNDCKSILLYSVPYVFRDFNLNIFSATYKSTRPRDTNHCLYHRVNNLRYDSSLCQDQFYVQFFHLRSLSIHLPFDKHFENIVPTFYCLNSLTILSTKENAQLYLQSLLDRAPCLHSLTVHSWPLLQIPVVENTSASLRQLDLRLDGRGDNGSFFSEVECYRLIHSPLGISCEELLIKVKSYESILDLVNNMANLRLLIVQYQLRSTTFSAHERYRRENDILIKWLRDQLPSTSTISKFSLVFNSLKLWICTKRP